MVEEEARQEETSAVEEEPEETQEENENEESQISMEHLMMEIEDLRKRVEEKADASKMEDMGSWRYEIAEQIEGLKNEMNGLKQEDKRLLVQMQEFIDIITGKNEEMIKIVDEKVDETKLRSMKKDFSKMNKKLVSLMEETGFGEIIDVTKIPPNILEIVYDTTLKDISLALWREYGPGAETVITDTLEKIRLETSGSEMFHYDGRYIRTRDVAKNIKYGMISAKQLQDTYDALLKALQEYVPAYKAKNFKAMIKLKSQEYTVDKTTHLLDKGEKIEENLSRIDSMLSSAVQGLSAQAERIADIKKEFEETLKKRLSEEMSGIDLKISAMQSSIKSLREEYETSTTVLEKKLDEREALIASLEERVNALENGSNTADIEKKEKKGPKLELEGLTEEEKLVVSTIGEGITYSKLKRSVITLISSPIDDILSSLTEKKIIVEKKKGKTRRFFPRPEKEEGEEKIPENEKENLKDRGQNSEDDEKRILDAIPSRGCTLNRLKKALEKTLDSETIDKIVDELLSKEYLVKTRRGRYTIYVKNEEKIGGEKDA